MLMRNSAGMLALGIGLWLTGCSKTAPEAPEKSAAVTKPRGAYRVYVTNETSGDLTVIDSADFEVAGTYPLGKRPRGIHPSPDGQSIYVALSGFPHRLPASMRAPFLRRIIARMGSESSRSRKTKSRA